MTRVVVAVMLVVLWLLLLLAPASSSLPLTERIAAGAVFTSLVPPLVWLRSRPTRNLAPKRPTSRRGRE